MSVQLLFSLLDKLIVSVFSDNVNIGQLETILKQDIVVSTVKEIFLIEMSLS